MNYGTSRGQRNYMHMEFYLSTSDSHLVSAQRLHEVVSLTTQKDTLWLGRTSAQSEALTDSCFSEVQLKDCVECRVRV